LELHIHKHFPLDQTIAVCNRRGEYIQLQSKFSHPIVHWHHLWRVYENGVFAYTGTIHDDFPNGKPIGDLARDLISLCRLANDFFESNDVQGDVYLGQMLCSTTTKFLAKVPVPGTQDYAPLDGMEMPTGQQTAVVQTLTHRVISRADLKAPFGAVAEILAYNLRELCGAQIDYRRFLSQIERLAPTERSGLVFKIT
jgi:hypothetical protein